MQVISPGMGCMGNGVQESQYSGEGALRWPSEKRQYSSKQLVKIPQNKVLIKQSSN